MIPNSTQQLFLGKAWNFVTGVHIGEHQNYRRGTVLRQIHIQGIALWPDLNKNLHIVLIDYGSFNGNRDKVCTDEETWFFCDTKAENNNEKPISNEKLTKEETLIISKSQPTTQTGATGRQLFWGM
jgi:hypothetical protein